MSLSSKLHEVGLKFDRVESGLLRGIFKFPNNRSQVFYLDPDPDSYGGHREHDFLSLIGPADDPANVKRACELAGDKKRGGIVVREGMILLKFEIPEDVDGHTAVEQIGALCAVADQMEMEIFHVDRV